MHDLVESRHAIRDVPRLMTITDAADYLGVSRRVVTRLVDDGRLISVSVGDRRFVVRTSLFQLARER